MNAIPNVYGLLVSFETPEAVLKGTRRARQAGYRSMDAYTPYPVEGLSLELGMRRSRIPSVVFIGGIVGAVAGFFMQYYAMAVNYPVNSGGRPLNSWPMFVPIAFEVLILVAALSAFISMVLLNGLPHPNHPIFNVREMARASQDRFLLCIEAIDPLFDLSATTVFLAGLESAGPVVVVPIEPEAIEESEPGAEEAPGRRQPAAIES
jgi:hypothetical protein